MFDIIPNWHELGVYILVHVNKIDIFFEWTESKHFNEFQYPQVVSAEQCIEYMHEARMDVLFLQLYWMVIGLVCISVIYLMCLGNKLSEIERKLDIFEEIREINQSHVKLV